MTNTTKGSKRSQTDTVTQEHLRDIFSYKDGQLLWKEDRQGGWKRGTAAGSQNSNGRRTVNLNAFGVYYVHHLVWLYHKGELPKTLDHKDHDPTNNSIENLRLCNSSQNNRNRKTGTGSSKYLGVSWSKGKNKWVAGAVVNGKRRYIGYFNCELDAATAYNFFCYNNLPSEDLEFVNYNTPRRA